ncbi:MAG: squalene--hopene cyclase [Planctomycetes bacterium]|nr:squalene--hopene cyclase [Planctomycetota bacterium]
MNENGSVLPEGADLRLPDMVIARAAEALIALQNHDGHWVGELEGDTILSSEYILLHYFLGWHERDADEMERCLAFLRRQQNEEGGFSLYPGGPSDISASVKAYFVLKLFGDDPQAPHMVKARGKIQRLGGIDACNTFTKIYLALFGQVSWRECPAVPPELILFPRWFPFNIYEMSSWSRTIVIPLSIIWSQKPLRKVPDHARLDELKVSLETAPEYQPLEVEGTSKTWQLVFTSIDKAAKLTESLTGRLKIRPLRNLAIRRALDWMKERFEDSDGLGGIFPPIINSLIAFHALGVPEDDHHFEMTRKAMKGLRVFTDDEQIRIQPCHSPVWDTGLAVNALALAGGDSVKEPVRQAVRWLLDREVKKPGDWANKVNGVEPAGWYFEYANEYYPDIDDTIMVMMALERAGFPEAQPALERAMKWVRAMQSKDGGWAAFDRDNNRYLLTNVPFADHNAMLDPPTADITARTLEMMGLFGVGLDDAQVQAAIRFIKNDQGAEGCWYGRWGVNYIYGTWQVLRGLKEIGQDMGERWVQRGADWLESVQNPDGGFGESIASYDDPTLKGKGPSTPSQTAWALMGLVAAGRERDAAARRAVEYLTSTQLGDGTWEEEYWTGTGFPKVFYLRYHLYRLYFPIAALALWRDALRSAEVDDARISEQAAS